LIRRRGAPPALAPPAPPPGGARSAVGEALQHVWQLLGMAQHFPALALHNGARGDLKITLPPVLLEQVLANLILNAAQAGATAVWLEAAGEAGGLRITLQDNGGGIDDALMQQVFQPFVTSRREGMGLGLVICQRLVRYCQGEIAIVNRAAPDGLAGVAVVLDFTHREEKRDNGNNTSAG
ncbi:ATP-binding protein, partial [Raoultella terrigena]|uniref:ATP-binding protein n=1 Tax=Raoultella terrigena TaxID=577 RepID=UPI00349F10D8